MLTKKNVYFIFQSQINNNKRVCYSADLPHINNSYLIKYLKWKIKKKFNPKISYQIAATNKIR